MRQKVYALSDRGQREMNTGHPTLPAELGDLLRLVDGQRTGADLLAAAPGKSAVTAGGLRWLVASGYITATKSSEADGRGEDSGSDFYSAAGRLSRVSSQLGAMPPRPRAPQPARPRSDHEVCRALSDFMVHSIRRRLGEGGYVYRRKIERAAQVSDLLPHLSPLIDAIAQRAGADAAAEFADTAAFILSPHEQGAALN